MSAPQNGAESDSASSASGSHEPPEIVLDDEGAMAMEDNVEMQEAVGKLDDLKIEPDTEVPSLTMDETEADQDGSSLASSGSQGTGDDGKSNSSDAGATGGSKDKDKGKSKLKSMKASMFNRLKRLTKFDKSERSTLKSNYSKFTGVRVDRLPQYFVAKYLGKREVKGLFGLEHVRAPVDEMIKQVREDLQTMDRVELPLVYVVFSTKGVDIREHPGNKVKDTLDCVLHPLDFISYGVQDMKYWRVFTFIVVKELSLREKKMECHAVLCDSSQNARKMALALGACFQVYKRKLNAEGKVHNFQVELRPPDELVSNLDNGDGDFEV